jgi:uncharacterized C2H2 Zn-finger protein
MMPISAKNLTGAEAIKLIREGQQLACPKCSAVIKTIPENWDIGMALHGLECPNNREHFYILCENAELVKEMRKKMQNMMTNQK